MENELNEIKEKIKSANNAWVKSILLNNYLTRMWKAEKINIYEAYLLQGEIINYSMLNNRLPQWDDHAHTLMCLEIMNQRIMALVFSDDRYANVLREYGLKAQRMGVIKKKHYIMDNYDEFINIDEKSTDLLQKLYTMRRKYDSKSDSTKRREEPYHVEVFPFDYYEPEKILLDKTYMIDKKIIGADMEKLLIELNL